MTRSAIPIWKKRCLIPPALPSEYPKKRNDPMIKIRYINVVLSAPFCEICDTSCFVNNRAPVKLTTNSTNGFNRNHWSRVIVYIYYTKKAPEYILTRAHNSLHLKLYLLSSSCHHRTVRVLHWANSFLCLGPFFCTSSRYNSSNINNIHIGWCLYNSTSVDTGLKIDTVILWWLVRDDFLSRF